MESAGVGAVVPTALPLSLSQREIWRDQRAWRGSTHLMIGGGGFLSGPLDLDLLQRALDLLIAESDALRLVPQEDGTQLLMPSFHMRLPLLDIDPAAEPGQAMQDWWVKASTQPFPSDRTPPWRAALLRAHAQLHALVMQFHHIVMDGWGTTRVVKRWSDIYNQLAAGTSVGASGAPAYRQFIEESNLYAASDAFVRDAAYWHAHIPELPPSILQRRADARLHGLSEAHTVVQPIARESYDALTRLAAARGVTAFNLLLAATALYFARVANQSRILVGVPTLNRSGRRYLQTPGMFVGMLVVGVEVDASTSATELIAAAGASIRGALRHPRYPLSELVRGLGAARGGRESVFDVLLSFEQQDYDVVFGAATRVDSRQFFSGVARYPLGLTVCEFHPGKDLELVLEGSSAYLSRGEVQLLGRRIWHVTQQLAAAAQALVQDIDIMPEAERRTLLAERGEGRLGHPEPQPFIVAFERHAALQPRAAALVWDGGEMDYQTLDRRANQLAHRLVALGVGPDRIVAVAIARSPDLVIALLAIAKAGGAFLPLDPDAPVARLAGIVAESAAVALLIQEDSWERLAHLHPQTAVTSWHRALADAPDTRAAPAPSPGQLAYVLFTSGSTGKPKGVMVEHATLSRRLAWLSRTYGVLANDRSALATQATFDPSLIELCLPLVHGASIALAPAGRQHPEAVAEFAIRHAVTIMAFVPSTLAGFLDTVQGRPDLRLRVACCGGEVLSPELARRYLRGTKARLFNVYGPTEACIFATAWECRDIPETAALPIGSPIDDTRIYVLDAQLRLLPHGVAGEVFIGGDALARGYLNRPELTRDAFLDDPFHPGARMYRTGDRGWLDNDGQLHFQGRLDRQIKLRGYRIELGEIEAALLEVEGVTQAAVQLVQRHGRPAIHAWVATTSGHGPDSVQRVLRVRLPDYMIPSAIGVFATLTTSSTGKIDYAALPEIADAAPKPITRGPSSAMERDMLELWEQVLQRRPLTVHDNFFDIGGDSLGAVSILTSVERMLARKVPMYLLTEHPTVERLVQALEADTQHPGLVIDFGPLTADVPLYLAASGHGDLMRFQTLARAMEGVCDLHMLQPPSDQPIKRITELAAMYADRIQQQDSGPAFIAGFSVGGIAALETARQLHERGVPVRGLILIDTVFPKKVWGGTFYWRLSGWLVRLLRIQDLSINGRRLGAMFNDPGLVGQVMAMSGYRAKAFPGPMTLIKTSGLARWDRALFGSWRKLVGDSLSERQIAGLHGSIFESRNVGELAALLSSIVAVPAVPE